MLHVVIRVQLCVRIDKGLIKLFVKLLPLVLKSHNILPRLNGHVATLLLTIVDLP